MTVLERRYRRLLLAYPRQYRAAHGDELLDVLLDSAAPGQSAPVLREAWGLLRGGVRTRITHQATGSAWADGLHLGITAVSAANLAALLPYAGSLPSWTLLSALALLAVMRGWVWPAFAITLATGVKAVTIAGGWQLLDLTLLPVYPSPLSDRPLFGTSSPLVVAAGYAVALSGLAVLAWWRDRPLAGSVPYRPRVRSWWWFAAALAASWAGPSWLPEDTWFPISLSKMAVEVVALGLAVAGAYLARDPRWALAAGIYLLVTSGDLGLHGDQLTRQHLAYWGVLVVLTLATAFAPYRQRRHCLD